MKVKQTREADAFGGAKVLQFRIIELAEGAELPEGATEVPDETPVCDWTNGE